MLECSIDIEIAETTGSADRKLPQRILEHACYFKVSLNWLPTFHYLLNLTKHLLWLTIFDKFLLHKLKHLTIQYFHFHILTLSYLILIMYVYTLTTAYIFI